VSGGSSGERGFITAYTDSTNGKAFAQEFATELAGRMTDAAKWREAIYVGFRQITLSTEVHSIRWHSNVFGSFTTVKRVFPQDTPPQIFSSLFAHNGFSAKCGADSEDEDLPTLGEGYEDSIDAAPDTYDRDPDSGATYAGVLIIDLGDRVLYDVA